jgi:hypothetical protein
MKEAIRRSFDRVRLSEADRARLLGGIQKKHEARRHKAAGYWIGGAAAVVAAAVILTIVLTGGGAPEANSPVADASAAVSAAAAVSSAQPEADRIACSIVLRINPSVEFRLGGDGMVIEVVGLNEDGTVLIDGIGFAGLSLENATIVVVNRLIERGYISASMVDDVYISVSGSAQPDTLSMMSAIIKTAASQYELAVDTVQTGEHELQVVLGDTDETGPEITPAPDPTPPSEATPEVTILPAAPADPASLPAALTLQYLKDFAGGVDDIYIDFNGERVNSDIDAYIDIAGMPTGAATFWALGKLIAEGYITDQKPDTKVEFDVSAFGEETAARVRELVALMVREAGLALTATDEGGARFCLAASGLPVPERTARYTLREIDDPTLIKVRGDITELQMQILSMAFTPEEVEYMLTPRYWSVMPNLIGLSEARARELLTLAGLQSVPSYEDGDHTGDVGYGEVFFQDYTAGGLVEVGGRCYFHVRAYPMPSVDSHNLPSDLLKYLPAFLDDTGHATVTVDRDTGMRVPIAFRVEGYDVVIHAFGGGWRAADGSYLWNEQYIATGSDEASVYWAADNGDGDDVPQHANLVYEIYRNEEYVASVTVTFTLVISTEETETLDNEGGADGILTYEASVSRFGQNGPYSYSDLY